MRTTAVLLCAIAFAGCSLVKPPTVTPPPATPAADAPTARELTPASDPALAAELAEMIKTDQEVRHRWIKDQNSPALREEMRQLSVKHVARMNEQMYGTQFDVDVATGKCQPQPIEDEAHVDERRIRAKMGTLADYTKELCDLYLQRK
jgi:hypothetical protein